MLAYMNLYPPVHYLSLAASLFAIFTVLLWSFRPYLRLRLVPSPFLAALKILAMAFMGPEQPRS